MSERWYLELSESEGSHKFYEVVLEGADLSIRYGRIGDTGQNSKKTFETPEKARAEAEKKIKDKTRGGYAQAVMGERQKRAVTARPLAEASASEVRAASGTKRAPVLWKFATKVMAFGICVTGSRVWIGNEEGKVFALSLEGAVEAEFKLPAGVKCIIEDGDFVYAGCNDGNVYDLNSKVPRVAYEIAEDVDIYWLDIHDALLAISDQKGTLTLVDHNDEFVWTVEGEGKYGWMVRADAGQVYHGHSDGITAYNTGTGQKSWHHKTPGAVLFGWQSKEFAYGGLSSNQVQVLEKTSGKLVASAKTDASVFSNAASDDGKYIFAGDGVSSVYCFKSDGERLWKLATTCGAALSMQYHDERVYIVTRDGSLACIDASEAAIQAAIQGTVPEIINIKAPANLEASAPAPVQTTTDSSTGVILECFTDGTKLRVRVVSPGFDSSWAVQFPSDIREAGAKYVADEVRESARGGFYRAYGEIRKLI
jgi:outer membrane protein assembly factor BamB